MKFLVDQNLSPRVAVVLKAAGHDATHTSDLGLATAPDVEVIARARDEDRILLTADADFGTILASTGAIRPSVVYVRRINGRRVEQIVELVLDNLAQLEESLRLGSLVVLGEGDARIRRLPIL